MVNAITAPRCEFGVIQPSTNTSVEAEFNWMLVPGVSWHSARIWIPEPKMDSDKAFESVLEDVRASIEDAVKSVMSCQPDYLVMGMSVESFWGGKDGAEKFTAWMKELSGLDVTTGAAACEAALDAYKAKKIGVITPYQPVGDKQVFDFFTQMDYEVKAIHGLKCTTMTNIADVTEDQMRDAFRKVNVPGTDALIQAGTNLACAKVAAEMEKELGKPVIAINTATVWHSYRTNGIMDQISGFGSLLEEH
ncbi:hypothetical protein NA57DRAFT_66149 [Rhizodiscina lignyota]|uniref:Arylmalonate decarboxylase n=1 Tax=Rhizodiscina lignyota TaxID=1504668 RepID=A0A9P4IGR6_9PEZI|nr:hypothetical protein NA57DRAFT_66149 [Rhizodiscina lignyota]